MASRSLTPARALRRPRRIDARAVVGVILLVVAIVGAVIAWSLAFDTQAVLVATRDLPARAILGPSDVAQANVRLDERLLQTALPASDLGRVVGQPLAEPVHAHQILVRPQLSPRPPLPAQHMALTVPVSPATALGGQVHVGDEVQVLVTVAKGRPDSRTTPLLPRVVVLDVGYEARGGALTGGGGDGAPRVIQWVTLALTPDQAQQLAQAKWNGEIDLALLPPTTS